MRRTDPKTLVEALRILARTIESGDGIANSCIAEAADVIEELTKERQIMTNETLRGQWFPCSEVLPPNGQVVMTKIDDEKGCRNEIKLKRKGKRWCFDKEMYGGYMPTHWMITKG